MADFDPDAYLAAAAPTPFNPDEYLQAVGKPSPTTTTQTFVPGSPREIAREQLAGQPVVQQQMERAGRAVADTATRFVKGLPSMLKFIKPPTLTDVLTGAAETLGQVKQARESPIGSQEWWNAVVPLASQYAMQVGALRVGAPKLTESLFGKEKPPVQPLAAETAATKEVIKNASEIPSAERVPSAQVRPGVDEKAPLRQQGQAPEVREKAQVGTQVTPVPQPEQPRIISTAVKSGDTIVRGEGFEPHDSIAARVAAERPLLTQETGKLEWREMPSVSPGGKQSFFTTDTPEGRRTVVFDKYKNTWVVQGEQEIPSAKNPSGRAPVLAEVKNAEAGKKWVESQQAKTERPSPTQETGAPPSLAEAATHQERFDAISAMNGKTVDLPEIGKVKVVVNGDRIELQATKAQGLTNQRGDVIAQIIRDVDKADSGPAIQSMMTAKLLQETAPVSAVGEAPVDTPQGIPENQRGFIIREPDGTERTVWGKPGRKEAARIANAAGQVKPENAGTTELHSQQLAAAVSGTEMPPAAVPPVEAGAGAGARPPTVPPPTLPAPLRPEPPPINPESFQETVRMKTPGSENAVTRIKNGLLSLVLPSMKSPEHLRAAEVLGSKLGEMNHRSESANFLLRNHEKTFTKLGVDREGVAPRDNAGARFASAIATGKEVDPQFAKAAADVRSTFQNRLQELEKTGAGLDEAREHYFPGMWTRESILAFNQAMEQARKSGIVPQEGFNINEATPRQKEWVRSRVDKNLSKGVGSENDQLRFLSKRPFKGKESFRKAKVFDDVMDAMEFGLRPVSNNPITLAKLKLAEMDRSIMANQALRDWEKTGDVANFNNSGVPLKSSLQESYNPNEWVKINDPYGTIWHRDPTTHLLEKIGERRAKAPVAEILNNYLSSNLYNSRYFGDLYKLWMGSASTLNQSQLGMGSAFHAGFTTGDVQVSAIAQVFKDMYGVARGNRSPTDLASTFGKSVIAMVRNPIMGDRVLNAWRDPNGRITPRLEQIVRAMELGGGGTQLERGFMTQQAGKVSRDWYSGHKIKATVRSPVAFTEVMARPIMQMLVPRQKAGVFAELAGRIIDQNPTKSLEELTPQFRQAWNRVDARLGQVLYDRLFMNNVAKNVVQGTVRAPGWTGGTIAEIGGAFPDTYRFFREWSQTGKAPAELPDRVAYTAALLTSSIIVNGALTYAFTGEKPHGMDFFAFRDGGRDDSGNATRMLIPSYVKDILAYSQSPLGTIGAKTHPMLSVLNDIVMKNQDYYGVEIRDPDAPYYKQGGQVATYVAKSFEPFWTRGARKEYQQGGGVGKAAAAYFGVMPAPKKITQTAAMKLISEIQRRKRPVGGYTKEQAEKREQRRMAQKGQDLRPMLFKRLSKEEKARVLEVATPEERAIFQSGRTRRFSP